MKAVAFSYSNCSYLVAQLATIRIIPEILSLLALLYYYSGVGATEFGICDSMIIV